MATVLTWLHHFFPVLFKRKMKLASLVPACWSVWLGVLVGAIVSGFGMITSVVRHVWSWSSQLLWQQKAKSLRIALLRLCVSQSAASQFLCGSFHHIWQCGKTVTDSLVLDPHVWSLIDSPRHTPSHTSGSLSLCLRHLETQDPSDNYKASTASCPDLAEAGWCFTEDVCSGFPVGVLLLLGLSSGLFLASPDEGFTCFACCNPACF